MRKSDAMQAMVLDKATTSLCLKQLAIPIPNQRQILITVKACGVCRTDLHIVDGELTGAQFPLIPGHQIIGKVAATGQQVQNFTVGDMVGVPWLGGSCRQCVYCQHQTENLCDQAIYTGYQINGGYAEYCLADSEFCFSIPQNWEPLQAAPLLCAGLIGYRALRKAGHSQKLGFYGFGASAHILTQLCHHQGQNVFAFTKPQDTHSQQFALKLGATWAGSTQDTPSTLLDAAIIFAPAGELVPLALKRVKKGGIVVCAGIYMSDIPSFPYKDLWGEREIVSVANLTRKDGEEFLAIAPKIPIKTEITSYKLEDANTALKDLRNGNFNGAAVLDINPSI